MPTRLSFLGSVASMLGAVGSVMAIFSSLPPSSDVNKKIGELSDIRSALSTLDNYVAVQQQRLREVSSEKVTLEVERDRIQRVLQIDRDRLDALLAYQIAEQGRTRWIERMLSFFIGVLSSSLVTFIAIWFQGRRRRAAAGTDPDGQA